MELDYRLIGHDPNAIRQNVLKTQQMEQEARYGEENQNWLRQQRGFAGEQMDWAREDRLREMEKRPMKDDLEATQYLLSVGPMIGWDQYAASRDYLINVNGINPAQLPEVQWFEQQAQQYGVTPDVVYEAWKNNALRTGQQRLELEKKRMEIAAKTGPAAMRFEAGKAEAQEAAKAKYRKPGNYKSWVTPDNQIVNLPADQEPPAGSVPYSAGIEFSQTGAGGETTSVRIGGVPGKRKDVTAKTKGELESKITNGMEQYTRMSEIASEFQPEFQQFGPRLSAAWSGIKAKMGKDISPEDKEFLTSFKAYQRKAIENINLYIKELTGAQMSEKEADRLRLAQPDPGESWWKGDDPITFKSKMEDVLKSTRAAVARYDYYLKKGLSDDEIRGLIKSGQAISLDAIISKMR